MIHVLASQFQAVVSQIRLLTGWCPFGRPLSAARRQAELY